jgi:hypothetical protein
MEEVIDSVKVAAAPLSNGFPGWTITPDSSSSAMENKMTDFVRRPLSRTGTRVGRDAVFGKQDEELSDIADEENPKNLSIKRDSRSKYGGFGKGDKRSSITVVTSPDTKDRKMDSDDDMDQSVALKTTGGRASAKRAVIDPETEDDDEVPKVTAQAGRRTRASTALADRLKIIAAAAMKTSTNDQATTASTKRPGGAALVSKTLQHASLGLDDPPLLPVAQLAQEPRAGGQSKRSAPPPALEDAFSGPHTSDHIPQAVADAVDPVGKPTAQIGLHLLSVRLMMLSFLKCH